MIKFLNSKATTVIQIDAFSSVTVLTKMSLRVKARVQDELLGFTPDGTANGKITIGAIHSQKLALLSHNIVRWDGPAFIGEDNKFVKFSREALESLDPEESEEFVDMVYAAISKLNQPKMAEAVGEEAPLLDAPAI